MSATYAEGSTAARDRVRRLIPDKPLTGLTAVNGVYTLAAYQFSDQEIADFLTDEASNVYAAAAAALESLIGSGAQVAEKVSIPGHSVDTTAGHDTLATRAAWLRSQAAGGAVMGRSISAINTVIW